MYQNVKTLTREEYETMINCGMLFRNWSLYEPQNNPKQTFYIVQLGHNLTLNKVPVI